jgi:C-terminal peptidase prc
VIHLIETDYIKEADPAEAMKGAYKGLVNSLDIFSCYLDKDNAAKYLQSKQTDLKDVGLVLYKRFGAFPMVIGLVKNSPAEKKGIQIGDLVSALDGHATQTMSLAETHLYLKDTESTPVILKTFRGSKTQEIALARESLYAQSFSYNQEKGTSGILTINQLIAQCVNSIQKEVMTQIKSDKETLILDLRNCHEGEIEEARKLINLFISTPSIGWIEKKGGVKENLSCPDEAAHDHLPLDIWINQATIGPAEVVAGVLQEFKRARIIGSSTLGLVAQQDYFALDDGSGLLLTSGIFYLSSGKKLWRKGIKPDIKIEGKDQSTKVYLKKSLSSPL